MWGLRGGSSSSGWLADGGFKFDVGVRGQAGDGCVMAVAWLLHG